VHRPDRERDLATGVPAGDASAVRDVHSEVTIMFAPSTQPGTISTAADQAATNIACIAGLYEAFGRGDLAAVLDQLAEDVSWDADWPDNAARRAGVPHLQARRGPAQAAGFFAVIADWQFERFEVASVIGAGDQVVAHIRGDYRLPGGGRLQDEELHQRHFRPDGKITSFRHYCDTAKAHRRHRR
jgi:ketosteroid isomerase-like protein